MSVKMKRYRSLACLLSTCIAAPGLAQQKQSQDRQNQQWSQSNQAQDRQSRQPQSQQRDSIGERSNQSRAGQTQSRMTFQPQGWVRMAVDYDNDGSYDAMETIYVYDLKMAQERSRNRRSGSENSSSQNSGSQNSGSQNSSSQNSWARGESTAQNRTAMQRRQPAMQRQNSTQRQDSSQQRGQQQMADRNGQQQSSVQSVSGKVQNIKQITLHDGQSKFKVAKVRTNDGRTARVLLGKVDQVDRLNLQDGDQIQVDGRRGKMNDRSILVANQIRSGDQSVRVQFDQGQKPLRQYKGTVEQTRTAQFRNRDGVYLVARLEIENGESKVVHLGPTSKLSPSAVKNADEVCVLATSGKVNGKEALIAEQVSLDGRKIDVSKQDGRRPQNWNTSTTSSSSGNNRNQQQQR